MEHKIPQLGYGYDALEPYIDARTMEIHYTKHHQGYVDKLNAALKDHPEMQGRSAEELVSRLHDVPEQIRTVVRNNGGGHVNHSFFWPLLKKGIEPGGEIVDMIESQFSSMEEFVREFTDAALSRFGSGWAWLVVEGGKLEILSTPNQDSPLTDGKVPILGIDVWEHAYYLKYQNRRADYVKAFFDVINWDRVNENLKKAKG